MENKKTPKEMKKPIKPKGMSVRQWMKMNFDEHTNVRSTPTQASGTVDTTSKLAHNSASPIAVKFGR